MTGGETLFQFMIWTTLTCPKMLSEGGADLALQLRHFQLILVAVRIQFKLIRERLDSPREDKFVELLVEPLLVQFLERLFVGMTFQYHF